MPRLSRLRKSHRRALAARAGAALAVLGATALFMLAVEAPSAGASVPSATDVMFIFDTSGSMESVLTETQEEITTLVTNLKAALPNVEFGVANVEDIPRYIDGVLEQQLTEAQYEEDTEKPWHLWQALTSEDSKVEEAINGLATSEVAHDGGDGPEAYGRALYETATNPDVGWRPGARHLIVMIADNVPHTPNVNEGIPAEYQFTEPFNDYFESWPDTGEELGGKWGIPDTQWKEGESLEFHHDLQRLLSEEKPLAMVDYHHTEQSEQSNYVHYWEYWAAATGGEAISAEQGARSLDTKLTEIIKESAEGIPPCAPGYTRTPTTPCRPVPPPSEVHLATSPPVLKHPVYVLEESGEAELEVEFPEAGEAEYDGEVPDGADLARVQSGLLSALVPALGLPTQGNAVDAAKHGKSKKCKKGFVKKKGKCVSTAPVTFGKGKLSVASPGIYKIHFKPSGKVLKSLKKGKKVKVRLNVLFTPAGTSVHLPLTSGATLHLKKKHKSSKGKGKKHKKK